MNSFSPQKNFMQAAIEDVRQHFPQEPGGPFGACIVKDNKIIAVAHNTVLQQHDPTCHAEVNAIRIAAAALQDYDLCGCEIYATTEPCPMCFSAIHWANIDRIVFGSRIADVKALGFNELTVSNDMLKNQGGSRVLLSGDFMREECLQLLRDWQSNTGGQTY